MTTSSISASQPEQFAYAPRLSDNASGCGEKIKAAPSQETSEQVNESSSVYIDPFTLYFSTAKTLDEYNQTFHEKDAKYNLAPHDATQYAMTTVTSELGKMQKAIELLKPDLAYKSWDFTLRDGQLEATGDKLTQKEKQWLTNVLNLDEKLVDATKKYYGAVVTFFENTADHTDPVSTYSSFSRARRYAYNVAEQINGKLPIKQMLIDLQSRSSTKMNNYKNTLDDARHYLTFSTENKFYADELRANTGKTYRYLNQSDVVEVSYEEYSAAQDDYMRARAANGV